jgi:Uma2 family endonuclease
MDAENVPQPDVLWVVPESQCVPEGTKRLRGAPDLIVEVLSPGTARLDKSTKFLLYERHGVREYWIADPKHRQLEVWTLVNGEYMQQGVYRPDETFVSVVLGGTAIAVKALFGG